MVIRCDVFDRKHIIISQCHVNDAHGTKEFVKFQNPGHLAGSEGL
jgi:hypothetical protein